MTRRIKKSTSKRSRGSRLIHPIGHIKASIALLQHSDQGMSNHFKMRLSYSTVPAPPKGRKLNPSPREARHPSALRPSLFSCLVCAHVTTLVTTALPGAA